jgi:hypothetical protein
MGAMTSKANDRITLYYHTEAALPGNAPATIGYSPAGPFPCYDRISPGAPWLPCVTGVNVFNHAFDASYTVTTTALNQVLRERQPSLAFVPTFDQLKVTPPAGKLGTDPWELDGPQLTALFPALGAVGATKLRMSLISPYLRFTWIPPDPYYWFDQGVLRLSGPLFPVPTGGAPLTYQIGSYIITFIGDQPGPDGTTEWLRFTLDLYDPDLQLKVANNGRNNLIVPSFSDFKGYLFNMVKSQLSGCPSGPATGPAKCGDLLASVVLRLVQPMMDETLISLLKNYPAPQYYDAKGTARTVARFDQTEKFQQAQVITFYGDLR